MSHHEFGGALSVQMIVIKNSHLNSKCFIQVRLVLIIQDIKKSIERNGYIFKILILFKFLLKGQNSMYSTSVKWSVDWHVFTELANMPAQYRAGTRRDEIFVPKANSF